MKIVVSNKVRHSGKSNLEASFALNMLSALIYTAL